MLKGFLFTHEIGKDENDLVRHVRHLHGSM